MTQSDPTPPGPPSVDSTHVRLHIIYYQSTVLCFTLTSRWDYCNASLLWCRWRAVPSPTVRPERRGATCVRDHIRPKLWSPHWLPVRQRVLFKIAVLVNQCLNGLAPSYLADMTMSTRLRCSSASTPFVWLCDVSQLPSSFRQPHSAHCPPGSPHLAHITSSQSPPLLSSPITASTFHSRLKTHLFHKSFPP